MKLIDRKQMLDAASLTRTNPVFDDMTPNFLLGNGLFGGCVDSFGMADILSGDHQAYSWHQFHVELGRDRRECRVPLLLYRYHIVKDGKPLSIAPETITNYRQTLSLHPGLLTTEYTLMDAGKAVANIHITQYVSLVAPYHTGWKITLHPLQGAIDFTFQLEMLDHCISMNNVPISYPVHTSTVADVPVLTSTTSRGQTHTALMDSQMPATVQGNLLQLCYTFQEETTIHPRAILLNCRENSTLEETISTLRRQLAATSLENHIACWQQFWNKSFIAPGDSDLLGIWAHFLYCLRSSQSDQPSVPMSPGGLASNRLWPYEFPQDYLWIYESFLGTNHLELAASTANYWNTILEQSRTFTKDNLGVDGVFFPWMPSHFDNKEQKLPDYDFPYPYQLHNSVYPLRMCYLYWQFTKDEAYLRSILPIAEGVADFYTAISTFAPDSQKYEIHFTPCMGQDEFGPFNSRNYLCCMTSAAHSIVLANKMYRAAGKAPKQAWLDIEKVGYAFEKLMPTGLLASYEGGPTPNPSQKHPSQLNTLAAVPLPEVYKTQAFKSTYLRRYEISLDSYKNFWPGWSMGTFLLASARMAIPEECQKDFDMLLQNRFCEVAQLDSENLQMVESSQHTVHSSYYLTVMAMVVTAITELFLQTFDGICKVFPVVLPSLEKNKLQFDRLLTPFGCTVSGTLEDGNATVELQVTEKVGFTLQLGPACRGQYILTDRYGNIVQESTCNLFQLSLDPGTYIIHN